MATAASRLAELDSPPPSGTSPTTAASNPETSAPCAFWSDQRTPRT